jgi:hypothetical protein
MDLSQSLNNIGQMLMQVLYVLGVLFASRVIAQTVAAREQTAVLAETE